jgi:hypothetical protein
MNERVSVSTWLSSSQINIKTNKFDLTFVEAMDATEDWVPARCLSLDFMAAVGFES